MRPHRTTGPCLAFRVPQWAYDGMRVPGSSGSGQ